MLRYRLAAVGGSLLLSITLVEAALRLMNLGLGNSPIESDTYLHHVHPRSYQFVQQHPSGELGGFAITYDAERRVVRNTPLPTARTPADCRIAFVGDSFTEAGQVRYEASFAGILESRAHGTCEVRNYGVRSYSPAIYLVQWEREIRSWQPTHIFVLLFGNDINDDRIYLQSAALDADGYPVAIQGPKGGWLTAQLRRSYIARYMRSVMLKREWAEAHRGQPVWTVGGQAEENPDWHEQSARLVLELHRRVSNAGAQLVLMAVPSRYRLMGDGTVPVGELDFHEKIRRWALLNGIHFLPLAGAFEAKRHGPPLYFVEDIHFTEAGHRIVADVITHAFSDLFPVR